MVFQVETFQIILNKENNKNNQKFTIIPTEYGYYIIKALHNNKVLDIIAGSTSNGA